MRRIFSLGLVLAGLMVSLGCCHTCDVCDDCGGCDSHYGVYGSQGCSSCNAGYAAQPLPTPAQQTTVAGPVRSTLKTR